MHGKACLWAIVNAHQPIFGSITKTVQSFQFCMLAAWLGHPEFSHSQDLGQCGIGKSSNIKFQYEVPIMIFSICI